VNIPTKIIAPLVVALAVTACNAGGSSSVPGAVGASASGAASIGGQVRYDHPRPACPGSRVGRAQCDALVLTSAADTSVVGWTAANLEQAYDLPSSSKGSGQIVGVVDAYDNPDIATDLATYRSTMGLPVATFYKYNQEGQQSNYPPGSEGWGIESSLDVEMVSASCPNCTIYLVEANSSQWSDLETAETEAVKLGATIVTNSYSGSGGSESYYDTPGIAYLASAGDYGYGLYDPATFKSVVSVGGTMLSQTPKRKRHGWTEVVWNTSGYSTGGGCSSTGEAKPSWQSDPKCSYRTGNDVAAVAWDVAQYDTYGEGGWFEDGGTSVSSPFLAGVFGLAGNATSQDGGKTFWTMSKKERKKGLYKITSGSTNNCGGAAGTYLCTAGTKQFGTYSGPDGWGTPHGIGAF
jgi:subtilase family serine protease